MAECDRCGEDSPVTTTLRNVSVSGGVVSALHSRMTVCLDCRGEMEDSDTYDW